MKRLVPSLLAAAVLLGSGALRLSFEPQMAADLRVAGLLPEKLQLSTREHMDQTTAAATLGGLRTLVASTLNLRAYLRFTEKKWDEVGDLYDVIVELSPNTIYYWESAAWHLTTNAVSYYRYESALPELRRRQAWQASFRRGRALLERGLRNNPESARLWMQLGDLLSDPNKLPDFTAAAAAYHRAAQCPDAPATAARFELYTLARIPDRHAEALQQARQLYAIPANRTPTLNAIVFVLEHRASPTRPAAELAAAIFSSPESAWRSLSNYRTRAGEGFPQDGVDEAIRELAPQPGPSR